MPIDTADARDYLNRWELVRDAELAVLRATSLATKVQQLASLMASRNLFGVDSYREQELQQVRERWARLRQAMVND